VVKTRAKAECVSQEDDRLPNRKRYVRLMLKYWTARWGKRHEKKLGWRKDCSETEGVKNSVGAGKTGTMGKQINSTEG